MSESAIYAKLEELREQYLNEFTLPPSEADVVIDDTIYIQQAWYEPHEKGELTIFLLKTKVLFGEKVFCVGLRTISADTFEKLNNEMLWEMGIP